jgi:hypothetical protein
VFNNTQARRVDEMTTSFRPIWRNCAIEADSEIQEIDGMEDRIAPIDPNISKIRELISKVGHYSDE